MPGRPRAREPASHGADAAGSRHVRVVPGGESMAPRSRLQRFAAVALPALLLSGCFDEPPLPESGVVVFDDAFATGFTPNAFAGSLVTSLGVDGTKGHS